jgi:hypothetical protein
MIEEKLKTVHFPEGEYLSAQEAGEVVRAAPTSVVVIAGVADSGKTTLVAGLFGLFHAGPFAGYLFAGSRTIPGFEKRCHFARTASGLTTPDTERTKRIASDHLLHLRLAQLEPLRHHEILLSDINGEAFRHAADSADECRKLTILNRADHVVVLIDGEKAIDRRNRQESFASAEALIGQCVDTGMLGKSSSVQAVLTKWDLVSNANSTALAFVESKLQRLRERYETRLGRLSIFKVAVRPPGGGPIPAGYGLSDLLKLWISVRARPGGLATPAPNGQYHTEFDRIAVSWPAQLVTEGEST